MDKSSLQLSLRFFGSLLPYLLACPLAFAGDEVLPALSQDKMSAYTKQFEQAISDSRKNAVGAASAPASLTRLSHKMRDAVNATSPNGPPGPNGGPGGPGNLQGSGVAPGGGPGGPNGMGPGGGPPPNPDSLNGLNHPPGGHAGGNPGGGMPPGSGPQH